MIFNAGNKLAVELTRAKETGWPWIVRVTRKRFLCTRVVATDWFLDEGQARRYVEMLVGQLRAGAPLEIVRHRKPGWVLRPEPPRG